MTTIEFGQRLLLPTKFDDIGTVPAEEALVLLQATNSAIQQFYRRAPANAKRTTLAGTLRAPTTVSIGVTKYSTLFTVLSATAAQRGCTIKINGDQLDNEITATNALLDEFLGETGSTSATIYGDAFPLNAIVEMMLSEPVLQDGSQRQLRRIDDFAARRRWRRDGEPRFYMIDYVGQSRGGLPAAIFRVDTRPSSDCRIRFEAQLSGLRIELANFTDAIILPLADDHIDSIVLPMAHAELALTSLWGDKETKRDVIARGKEAMEEIRLIPTAVHSPNTRIFRPRGW